jgi:hypothetical protein
MESRVTHFRKNWTLLVAKFRGDEGMLTAEYAMTTVAACGGAGILYKILTSDAITNLISELFKRALGVLF